MELVIGVLHHIHQCFICIVRVWTTKLTDGTTGHASTVKAPWLMKVYKAASGVINIISGEIKLNS
jgi:hypothetical protein